MRGMIPYGAGIAFALAVCLGAGAGIRPGHDHHTVIPATTQKVGETVPKGTFVVARTFNIGGDAQWDQLIVDAEGKRLYVPRVRQTLVIDVATGKTLAEIGPSKGACAVALVPESNRGFISNRFDGTLSVFDLKTNNILGKIDVGDDPGAILYDPFSKRILVCCAGAKSLVPVPPDIDLKTGKPDPSIDLGGKAQRMVSDGQGMVYITMREREQVTVIDTRSMKVATTWPVMKGLSPAGIAMDTAHSRLFVSGRAHVNVLAAADGHTIADIPLALGTEEAGFFDGEAFTAGADGTFTVIEQDAEGKFSVQQSLHTGASLRTMAINPRTGAIYLPAVDVQNRRPVNGSFKILVVEKK